MCKVEKYVYYDYDKEMWVGKLIVYKPEHKNPDCTIKYPDGIEAPAVKLEWNTLKSSNIAVLNELLDEEVRLIAKYIL